ncbi:hypothetical protein K461DRAFT_320922 [Myriangium duriaei CBS 260.36]|uniref:Protein HRI1 n=1 Tax=Myriangium duriaei CBS 260.36 TaxID=1168546 RepID=A0A9P4MG68_9PEZI|nr:hypothetical protein K461DRAFT_320922 [Myriangium duriaei CBS 260.36]
MSHEQPPKAPAQASISWREYIQWLPDPPSEPTSTLVLTSPSRRFVDIRLAKPTSPDEPELPNEGGPFSRLTWAFAGTSSTVLRPADPTLLTNDTPLIPHCTWTHWIDSHAAPNRDTDVLDEGDMYPSPSNDGRTLERGAMVNPATGIRQEYEECWVDEDVGVGEAVVVMLEDEGAKGMVVRVGGWCQGILKVVRGEEAEVSVERWKKGDDGSWRRVMKVGRLWLPCAVAWEKGLRLGQEVSYQGWEWKVVEAERAS